MKAIWRVGNHWFTTKRAANDFITETGGYEPTDLVKVEIACYLNPQQLVDFIHSEFPNGVHKSRI